MYRGSLCTKTRISRDPVYTYRGNLLQNPQHLKGYPTVGFWARADRWVRRYRVQLVLAKDDVRPKLILFRSSLLTSSKMYRGGRQQIRTYLATPSVTIAKICFRTRSRLWAIQRRDFGRERTGGS